MTPGETVSHTQGLPATATSVLSSLPAHPQTSQGKKEKSGHRVKPSLKEAALLLLCKSDRNTIRGRQIPEILPLTHGHRLGKEEGKLLILSKAIMAPLTAFTGHGLLSLPQEPPVFSFSGTGGIYFLCHFGGCLPCQRLFCRVQTDKKVVSRLFGGGREDCLVRERRLLCSQQPHAALPLRPPLWRWGQSRATPTPLHPGCFSGTSARGATLVTRACVPVPGLGSVSPGIWEMRLMNVQSNISIANLRALLQQ